MPDEGNNFVVIALTKSVLNEQILLLEKVVVNAHGVVIGFNNLD